MIMPDLTEQKFAWNSSLLSNDRENEEFFRLMDALIKSNSIEEFKIYKDLITLDKDQQEISTSLSV